jgi:hypothetical protein
MEHPFDALPLAFRYLIIAVGVSVIACIWAKAFGAI